ncbi:acyl-CoA dehydrogenase family protein [Actinosynnema pretiosum]|uniref:acyl-CoA dehydrogenase family protein n=1 Tax=Actinosynnema pretiosum TaxID=42197 RepID=UPI0012FDA419|nr:acyl-CoA dehydrogenase family protein [Actinosynnema pretiosum]
MSIRTALGADSALGGVISAGAGAEVAGAANQRRTTVAAPVDGGYRITGEKVFIGNGSVAVLLDVSATVVAAGGSESVRLFFVETGSPGFAVVGRHEFMGFAGRPSPRRGSTGCSCPRSTSCPSCPTGGGCGPPGTSPGPVNWLTSVSWRCSGGTWWWRPRPWPSPPPRGGGLTSSRRRIDGRVLGQCEEVRRLRAELESEREA